MHRFYKKTDSNGIQLYSDVNGNTFICVRNKSVQANFYEVKINEFGQITLGTKKCKGFQCIIYNKLDDMPANLDTDTDTDTDTSNAFS